MPAARWHNLFISSPQEGLRGVMMKKIALILSSFAALVGFVYGVSTLLAAPPEPPTFEQIGQQFSMSGGVVYDSEGEAVESPIFSLNSIVAIGTEITMVQMGDQVNEGETVFSGQILTATFKLSAGRTLIFVGNTGGTDANGVIIGTWVPNPSSFEIIEGDGTCSFFLTDITTQADCVGEGLVVELVGTPVVPPDSEVIVTDPYMASWFNPGPDGVTNTLFGIWAKALYLPSILNN